jgi:uncharacterized RDD family membrane protein YckC
VSERLVTPEAVELVLEPAGPGSRAMALAIDLAIQAVLVMSVVLGVVLVGSGGGEWAAVIVLVVAVTVIIFGYPMFFEALWRGRTPGKAALGLRVVTRDGAPPGFREAAIRAVLLLVDLWLTSASAGVLSILFTRDARRLGDLAAGTLVVRRARGKRSARALDPVRFLVPRGYEWLAETLDVGAVTADDYHAIRRFLLRAPDLPGDRRAELAARLAGTMAVRVRTTPRSDVPAEVFLLAVAARYQAR